MYDLKYQFHQDNDQSFYLDTHHKARVLEKEMHELSQNFVLEMCSCFYQEPISSSGVTEEEAWDMVGTRKMFEIIQVTRA
jgi:hypothetical protein